MKPRNKIFLSLAACLLLTSACAPTQAQRGNMVQDYQLAELVPGVHSRTDALRILGSPTTTAPFDENVWYYIGQETEKHGILDPEVMEERIIVVTFNEEGIIKTVDDVDSERLDIPYERNKTVTHGNDLSIMQELLGNLGKFNPQDDSGPAGR